MTLRLCIRTHTEIDLTEFVHGHDMIVAVSDTHLGDNASNKSGFIDFIEEYLKPNSDRISELVLLGDILDLWKRDTATVVLENLDILKSVCSLGFRVIYIVGNHDSIMAEIDSGYFKTKVMAELIRIPDNMNICTSYKSISGESNFHFIHGHQVDYWYALTFYHAFCRAMCNVDKLKRKTANIWNLVSLYLEDESSALSSRVIEMTAATKNEIAQKLAGPLEEHSLSKEESALLDFSLLRQFVDLDRFRTNALSMQLRDFMNNEIRKLHFSADDSFGHPEGVRTLLSTFMHGTPSELLSYFLRTWTEIHKRVHDLEREGAKSNRVRRIIQYLMRVAAMLTTGLQSNEFLVRGHGHQPYIDSTIQIADAGCWLRNKGSFIVIDKGVVSLSTWPIE